MPAPAGILEALIARLDGLEHAVLTLGDEVRAPQPPAGSDPSVWADGALDTVAAREFLALSESELYKLMARGELPYARHGVKRLLPRRALVRWLEARPVVRAEAGS